MRQFILAACLIAVPALAQVSTDDHALDQLAPAPAAKPAPVAKPAAPRRPHTTRPAPVGKRLPATQMPAVAPIHPVIQPPVFTMPAHAPPPPPPVSVRADAAGIATPIQAGSRISFGPGVSDLNPATLAAVQAIAAQALAQPTAIIDITAWAPGTPDDPSTARRLSLDRALAARGVMIHAGVVSERIRTVAKGAGAGDYADIVVEKK